MKQTIEDNKFIELNYKIIDKKTKNILIRINYPLGYVHGANDVLVPEVSKELVGKAVGDVIEIDIDCNKLYGPRDESLVFTDHLKNVPKKYRKIGTKITMENTKGEHKDFFVTRIDDKTLTVDGNNPLSGREVTFKLKVLSIRDATAEEIEAGGPTDANPDINEILK